MGSTNIVSFASLVISALFLFAGIFHTQLGINPISCTIAFIIYLVVSVGTLQRDVHELGPFILLDKEEVDGREGV